MRQFGGVGGLTRTLQTRHKDDGGIAFQVHSYRLIPHQMSQFIVGNLHHQLPRTDGGHHLLAKRLLLHAVGELLGGLVIDIRFQQCLADILDCLGYVDIRNTTLTLENLETALQSFA